MFYAIKTCVKQTLASIPAMFGVGLWYGLTKNNYMVKIFTRHEVEAGLNIIKMDYPNHIIDSILKLKGCIHARLKIFDEEAILQPDG